MYQMLRFRIASGLENLIVNQYVYHLRQHIIYSVPRKLNSYCKVHK